MKFFTGCVAAATLALAATAAQAQVPASGMSGGAMIAVSDFEGPYGPPDAAPPPPPRYGYGYGYEERGPAPALLPATEVYAVLRENGFSPLGIPRLRGAVYTIAVIDRRGDDGRLVIDARDGRIVRFLPARGIGPASDQGVTGPYGPQDVLPPPTVSRAAPRPPASIPHVASRTVPVPKPSPLAAKPVPAPAAATAPAPAQQAAAPAAAQQAAVTPPVAAAQPKPEEAQATAQAAAPAPTVAQAPLAPAPAASAILPTQDMPKVQGLE